MIFKSNHKLDQKIMCYIILKIEGFKYPLLVGIETPKKSFI